ncbi:hypothetical protein [Halorubrum aethiopicum]|uniref:hypothetical protein n=1 Tax=Halorubrum aethiopicum TaxID=1758255 RepID=UPI000A4EDF2C|nr:hypothetical protein [Halorubrum aethiopicum]
MPLYKRDVEDKQAGFKISKADTEKLSDDPSELYYDIFTDRFMSKYTRFTSFREFMYESPTQLDHPPSPQTRDFDRFVSKKTVFDDWEEMKEKAIEEWVVSEIDP